MVVGPTHIPHVGDVPCCDRMPESGQRRVHYPLSAARLRRSALRSSQDCGVPPAAITGCRRAFRASRGLGPVASSAPVFMIGLLRDEQMMPVKHPAYLLVGLASALVCAGSVLNLIAVSDQWGRYKDLPRRARFVAVNRDHPRLRGTAIACLMVALVFSISYVVTLFA